MSVRTEKAGAVWIVIHSRPETRNAVDPESATALYDAFLEFEEDGSAVVAVLWGEGGAFCSGWDLEVASGLDPAHALEDLDPGRSGSPGQLPPGPMGPTRLQLTKPVIAAVAGPAVAGGMELAMWCDFRVMEEDAYMGVYCRRWGIPLIDGGTFRLPRLVGEGRARELILTGRKVTAAEAHQIGLCEYVVPSGEARRKAEELARDIAAFPQACVRSDLKATKGQGGLTMEQAITQEWEASYPVLAAEGIDGAGRFSGGEGRHGAGV